MTKNQRRAAERERERERELVPRFGVAKDCGGRAPLRSAVPKQRDSVNKSPVKLWLSKCSGRRPRLIVLTLILGTILTVGFNLSQTRAQSASDSGTSIPIKKGGTGATTAAEALQNLGVPDLNGNDGKVLGLDSGNLAWVEQDGGGMLVPDYANMETIDRVTNISATWTADKTGFMYLSRTKSGGAYDTGNSEFTINGVKVSGGTAFYTTGIVPIKQGDILSLTGSSATNVQSKFIPPLFIKKELPVIVEKNGSYSLDEIKTADTWIDGKPIYKRSMNVHNASTWNSGNVNLGVTVPDIKSVINYEIHVKSTDTSLYGSDTYANIKELRLGVNPSGVLAGYMPTTIGAMVENTMIITVWYTKTTD